MNEPTTPPDSPGPMPGKLGKRRATEKPWHREALQLYLKDRSIKRVADAIGRLEKVVQAWSARYGWGAQAAAYDLHQAEIQTEEQDRQTREHTAFWVKEKFEQQRRDLKSGRAMQDKGDRKLNLPTPSAIKEALASTRTVQEIEEFELDPLGKKDDDPQT